MEEDFFKDLLNEIMSDMTSYLKCNEIQQMINFCKENYDNWKDTKLEYSIQISDDTELQFDVNSIEYDEKENLLLFDSTGLEEDKILTIYDLEKFLDFLREEHENWPDAILICNNDILIDEKTNEFPLSTYLDEEDNVLSFIL
jgi:hypothetical protein